MKKYLTLILVFMFSVSYSLYAIKHSDIPVGECHALNGDSITTGHVALERGGLGEDVSSYDGVLIVTGGAVDSVKLGTQDSSAVVTVGGTLTLSNKTIDGDDNTLQDVAFSSLSGIDSDTKLLTTAGISTSTKKVVTDADTVITLANFKTGYIEFNSDSDSIDVVLPSASSFQPLASCLFYVPNYTNDIDIETASGEYVVDATDTTLRDSVISFTKQGGVFILTSTGQTASDTVQWLIKAMFSTTTHVAD